MMGGLTFMVNEKMCVGILKDELMARINDNSVWQFLTDKKILLLYTNSADQTALKKNGAAPKNQTSRKLKSK